MTVKPLEDRVLLRPVAPQERTKGGIFLPETAKEKTGRGVVLAVGPGRLLEDGTYKQVAVNVGDTVLFTKYAGNEIELDGGKLLICGEREIMAKVEGVE